MYKPVNDGIEKSVKAVEYNQASPPPELSMYVDNFWELKTLRTLDEDFCLHALPDACVNILLNQLDTRIAGITQLQTTYEVLNLGRTFHYVGVQLLPGAWQGSRKEIKDSYVGTPYEGDLPLIQTNKRLTDLDFSSKQAELAKLVQSLIDKELIVQHDLILNILENLESIRTVTDMAEIVSLSSRQLQRNLRKITGFTPHDFLKVLRLQQSFKQESYYTYYSDQSHFIHAFQEATGYTPKRYAEKFNV